MKPLHHASTARRASLPGAAAELCDRKGARVVAKAGTATEKDHDKETSAKEAVLSGKILHECRVFFNDFGGYRAQATMGAAMLEPLTFRGLPLSALRQPDVRRRCLETFLRALQRDGSEKESEKRISGWGFGLSRASTRGSRKRRALTAEGSERPTTSYAAKALLVTRRRHAVNRGDAPFAHARFLRGCVRAKLADWRGAEVDFTAYLEAAPPELKIPTKMSPYLPAELDLASQRAQALTLLGVARGCNRHWSGAVARLTEAAQIEPEPRRLCLLGRVHACERQWLLAMDRYRDALNLDASLEMARVGLDQVRIKHEPMPLVTGLI